MQNWDIRALDLQPHHPQVLRSDDDTRAVAINLPAGEELQEHQTYERVYLVVAEGELEISQDGETATGGAGSMWHFEPGERRSVRANADSRLILLLAPWPGEGHPSRPRTAG